MRETDCRVIVFQRSDGLCERCGRWTALSLHHRKKRSQGGRWTPENIVAVCGSGTTGDHGWIEEHPDAAETEGFHVRPWQNPADVPIKIWGTWYLLLPDGSKEEYAAPVSRQGVQDDGSAEDVHVSPSLVHATESDA